MKTYKFLFILLFLSLSLSVFSQTKSETFKVAGECGTCKKKIEAGAKKAGATYAVWNTDNKLLTVKFNGKSSSKEKIEKAIAVVGYDTPDYKATDEAYNKLDDCCQYERTASMVSASCCDNAKCKEAACMKEGKCAKDAACCKKAGCDKKDCCKKA